ncbi:MAG: hypothetical protein LBT20_08850 [Clostridiales bacterium]|jgi:hypothetical protein|nr:hypothetical protein [Clostridiales bacterium]
MNNKKKLAVLMLVVIAMSVMMLSSCSVYYAGKYEYSVPIIGTVGTVELTVFGKATLDVAGFKGEGKYKVEDKKINVYDEDGNVVAWFSIESRKELKLLGEISYKRV